MRLVARGAVVLYVAAAILCAAVLARAMVRLEEEQRRCAEHHGRDVRPSTDPGR